MDNIEEVYTTHGQALLRHATVLVGPADAADLVSDVVLVAISDRRWVKADKPIAYLHRSLLNAARMRHRSNDRREAREKNTWALRKQAASPSSLLLNNPDVLDAVGALSPQQRAVIYFTYWEDLRPSEIARTLGVAEGSVKKHLVRARKNLKEALHEHQH